MAATLVQTQTGSPPISSVFSRVWLEKASEYFWCTLCLLLFMVLGPFSAPIVLGYIFFGKLSDQRPAEPDPRITVKSIK